MKHLFFSCPLAQSGLAWIQTLLSRACPAGPYLSLRHVRVGFSFDELRVVPRVFAYLVNVCSYLVWMQRNDFRFHSIPPSAVKLIALTKARLSFHLPLFSKRFTSTRRRSYFFRQWAANGMFGSFRNSTFTFTLRQIVFIHLLVLFLFVLSFLSFYFSVRRGSTPRRFWRAGPVQGVPPH